MGHYDTAHEFDQKSFSEQKAIRDTKNLKEIETDVANLIKAKGLVRALSEIIYETQARIYIPSPDTYK